MVARTNRINATLLAALAVAPAALAGDWPRFRGPAGLGIATEQKLPERLTKEDLRWRVELPGRGHSSPVVWGDSVFVTAHDRHTSACLLICLDTDDGSRRWVRPLKVASYGMHDLNSYASTTPTVDEHAVALTWNSGGELRAAAFDHGGEPLWERTLGAAGGEHGEGASAVLFEGTLLVANDTEDAPSFLVGLDARTGEPRWKRRRETSRASFATPLVQAPTEGPAQAIFASTSHGLTALEPHSGELLWERPDLFRARCVASPALAAGILFATAGSGGGGKIGVALDLRIVDGWPGDLVWF